MNILKQWYLRLFRGYIKTDEKGKLLISVFTMFSEKRPEFIYLGSGKWLISPPKERK